MGRARLTSCQADFWTADVSEETKPLSMPVGVAPLPVVRLVCVLGRRAGV